MPQQQRPCGHKTNSSSEGQFHGSYAPHPLRHVNPKVEGPHKDPENAGSQTGTHQDTAREVREPAATHR
jgi:hypothetical protein